MEELANAVRENAVSVTSADMLDEAAQKWATNALVTYRDELLTRALEISRAIAQFVAELRDPGPAPRR